MMRPNRSNSPLVQRTKERAWNNLNNDGAGFLFLTKQTQKAHSHSTQRFEIVSSEAKRPARMYKLFHARS